MKWLLLAPAACYWRVSKGALGSEDYALACKLMITKSAVTWHILSIVLG